MRDAYSGCGRLSLRVTLRDALRCAHPGPCDDDVGRLVTRPEVRAQCDAWPADVLRDELRGWGAWDADELADHEDNRVRFVWLACTNIVEEARDRHPQLMKDGAGRWLR
jgi:hypothetical protein